MRTKECRRCRRVLPWSAFTKRVDQGATRRRAQCRECVADVRSKRVHTDEHRAIAAERMRLKMATTRAWLSEIRLAGCADCGYAEHAAALDFDHRPGTIKEFPIMRDGVSRSRERLLAEIAKCDVVCANCHRVRTFDRRREAAA